MRLARPLVLLAATLAVAACTSFDPSWTFAPPPSTTPIPSAEGSAGASVAPSTEPSAGTSAAPSTEASAPAGPVLSLTAVNIAFDTSTLTAPANTPFTIAFQNDDNGVPHNVEIKDGGGNVLFSGELFNGVDKRDYAVPALAAGSYVFWCIVHPNMTGTLTVQ